MSEASTAEILVELRSIRQELRDHRKNADERHEADITWKRGHDEIHRGEREEVAALRAETADLRSTADKGDGALRALLWVGGVMLGLITITTGVYTAFFGDK